MADTWGKAAGLGDPLTGGDEATAALLADLGVTAPADLLRSDPLALLAALPADVVSRFGVREGPHAWIVRAARDALADATPEPAVLLRDLLRLLDGERFDRPAVAAAFGQVQEQVPPERFAVALGEVLSLGPAIPGTILHRLPPALRDGRSREALEFAFAAVVDRLRQEDGAALAQGWLRLLVERRLDPVVLAQWARLQVGALEFGDPPRWLWVLLLLVLVGVAAALLAVEAPPGLLVGRSALAIAGHLLCRSFAGATRQLRVAVTVTDEHGAALEGAWVQPWGEREGGGHTDRFGRVVLSACVVGPLSGGDWPRLYLCASHAGEERTEHFTEMTALAATALPVDDGLLVDVDEAPMECTLALRSLAGFEARRGLHAHTPVSLRLFVEPGSVGGCGHAGLWIGDAEGRSLFRYGVEGHGAENTGEGPQPFAQMARQIVSSWIVRRSGWEERDHGNAADLGREAIFLEMRGLPWDWVVEQIIDPVEQHDAYAMEWVYHVLYHNGATWAAWWWNHLLDQGRGEGRAEVAGRGGRAVPVRDPAEVEAFFGGSDQCLAGVRLDPLLEQVHLSLAQALPLLAGNRRDLWVARLVLCRARRSLTQADAVGAGGEDPLCA